jgi:prepilin-type N-terminal cleavage/methylation domain-containing protein
MKTRPGVTLLEVLTAIFIMGIGLLALLALFPLGASTMTHAMQDARCFEAGSNAKAGCIALGIRQDQVVTPLFRGDTPGTQLPDDWTGPSYPVFVDPIGLYYIGPANNSRIPGTLIPRVGFSQALTGNAAMRWCSLGDDYTFDANGSASLPTGVERESRYTWGYMMRRPNMQNPSVVEASVVCYAGRNLQVPGGETIYSPVTYSFASPRTLILSYVTDKPNLKRGGWLLDATEHKINNPAERALAMKYGPVHGYFYRIIDFADVNVNQIEVELQTVPVAPITKIAIMDNVAEVFPIGTGRP